MSRTAYLCSLTALFAAFVACTALWQEELSRDPLLRAVPTAVLLGGSGALTMIRKRTKQARSRSRAVDSIERRASERASEAAFGFALVLLAALMACLTFAWGVLGSLVGMAALALATGAFWLAYARQLREMTSGAQPDS